MPTPTPDETAQFIGAEGTEPVGETPRTGQATQRELEEMLDAALACTFPASDPIGCFTLCSSDSLRRSSAR
jgi:hypothetical protein